MKKALSLFLAAIFLISFFTNTAVAESNNISLSFDISCKDEYTAAVKTGEVITVTYNLENTATGEDYTISSVANEIYFDHEFFEYMGDEKIVKAPCTSNAKLNVRSWGEHRVYFNGSHLNKETYSSKQFMGSFKLKVKATSGSSTVSSKSMVAFDNDGKNYDTTSKSLTVFIGSQPSELYTVTYINNDKEYKKVQTVGSYILEGSPSIPKGYKFVGWKSSNDNQTYQPGTEFNITADTTFTAVWEKIQTEGGSGSGGTAGGGGGGSADTSYTLSFETNGGTAIKAVSKVKNTTVDLSKYITAREGFSFDGWYTDKELSNRVFEIKMTGNITLYAKWVEGDNGYIPQPSHKPDIFTSKHIAYIVGDDDGYVYPDSNLTRAEAAEIFYRLLTDEVRAEATAKENSFTDVNASDWFNTSVSTLAALKIINGRELGIYAPNETITRAELTTIMVRLSDAEYNGENIFADISGHWASDSINIAASLNWVEGYDGMFRPDDSITRAEAITIINRVLNRLPSDKSDLLDSMITPPDNTDDSAWYYLAIQEAVNSHDFEQKENSIYEKWINLSF